jgi:NTE family protein
MVDTNQQAKLHQRSQQQYHNDNLQTPNGNNNYIKSMDLQKKYVSFKSDNAVDIENKKTRPHRALVLQGGGALGAYEAGVFKALAERITKDDELAGEKNRPLFDIVAGTSIGAVNAAILVSYVKQNKTWKGADKALYQFWDDLCNPTWWAPMEFYDNPLFIKSREFWINNVLDNPTMWSSWDYWKSLRDTWNTLYLVNEHLLLLSYSEFPPVLCWKEDWPYFNLLGINKNKNSNDGTDTEDWREERPWINFFFWRPDNTGPIASGETARRYFSYLWSLLTGVPRVLAPGIMQPDWKFFNFSQPFTRFDNKPLERTIKKYWDYAKLPLRTAFENNEPRLLLVSVDVQDCTSAVTFDSYPETSDGKWCRTEYGEDQEKKYVMEYDGITIEHVNASMSTHLRYKYPHFPVQELTTMQIDGQKDKQEIKQQKERYFWDGAYLSNTPLRELLQAHRDYWHKVRNKEVPDLEVYIVNLYPSTENSLQGVIADADVIQDREIDIKFHDRTKYDIQVSNTITDYVDLNNAIIDLAIKHAKDKNVLQADLAKIMNSHAKSKGRDRVKRKYRELIDGRFNVIRVGYIERQDDDNTIFGKAFEFSYRTINSLRDKGYQEAQKNIRYE